MEEKGLIYKTYQLSIENTVFREINKIHFISLPPVENGSQIDLNPTLMILLSMITSIFVTTLTWYRTACMK